MANLITDAEDNMANKTTDVEANTAQQDTVEWKAGKRELTVLSILTVVNFVVALDATILVAALPAIDVSLNGDMVKTFWVSTSFLLADSVVIPFMGALSDVLGRREVLVATLTLFTVGSIIAGVAHNMVTLIVGRVIQGVGAGGITPLCQIILTDIVPLRQMAKYNSFNLIGYTVGTVLGPVLGGLFSEFVTWRWIFFFNLPFCGLSLVTVPWLVRLKRTDKSDMWQELADIDWLGGVIFIGSLTSFLMALTWAGVLFPWRSTHSLIPLIIGAVGLFVSAFWEKAIAKEPFIRVRIFNNVSSIAGYLAILLQGVVLCLQIFYIPLYFIATRQFGATHAGVTIIPICGAFVPSMMISGIIISRTGHSRWTLYAGGALMVLSNGLLLVLKRTTPTGGWVMIFIVVGISNGLLFAGLRNVGQAFAQAKDAGHAATMFVFLRVLGNALGVACGASLLQNQLSHHLAALGLDPQIADNAAGYAVSELPALPAGSRMREDTIVAYEGAMKNLFEFSTALAALIFVMIFFVRKMDLNQKQEARFQLSDRKVPVDDGVGLNDLPTTIQEQEPTTA